MMPQGGRREGDDDLGLHLVCRASTQRGNLQDLANLAAFMIASISRL